VSGETLTLAAPAETPAEARGLELNFRADYTADKLSACELEALAPVLPELVGELLAIMSLQNE
jgi:hypothetical protein